MDDDAVDPTHIHVMDDLVDAITRLRRRNARRGQVQLSVRDLAQRTGRAPSTLDPYLRGQRLFPGDVYEDVLRALGVANDQLRPWLDAWERVAEAWPAQPGARSTGTSHAGPTPARDATGRPMRSGRYDILPYRETHLYRVLSPGLSPERTIGIVTGDIRRVQCADIWVNSENTEMRMSRFEEYSISAIIRFGGATHDEAGRVIDDRIADELAAKVRSLVPVAPGAAISTSAGELSRHNGVRRIIHVAAVHGEPGEGYRQVRAVGACVTNALEEADRLAANPAVRSILFPILGTGVAGGAVEPTVRAMVGAIIDCFAGPRPSRLHTVYLLASTAPERDACRTVLDRNPLVARSG
jgi:O-acetyl-ADP-ribose deacetylase (regulator of RNase III)